jgi:WD40 repeat protein
LNQGRTARTIIKEGGWQVLTDKKTYLPCTIFSRAKKGDGLAAAETDEWKHFIKQGLPVSPIDRIGVYGNTLAVSTHGKKHFTKVFSLESGNCLLKYKNATITKPYIFLSRSHFLLSTDMDWRQVEIRDIGDGKYLYTLEFPYGLHCFCFSHDGRRMLTVSAINLFREWDLKSGQCLNEYRLKNYPTPVTHIDILPDDMRFLTLSTDSDTVICHDLKTGGGLGAFRGQTKMIYYFKLFPDGQSFAIRGIENKIEIIHIKTGESEKRFDCKDHHSNTMYVSKDARSLISFMKNGENILVWDTNKETFKPFSSRHVTTPYLCRFINEKTLFISDEHAKHKLVFIDIATDTLLGTLHNFEQHYLWETTADQTCAEVLFWSDNIDETIDVVAESPLPPPSSALPDRDYYKRKSYIFDHLDQQAVMARIQNKKTECQFHRKHYPEIKNDATQRLESDLCSKLLSMPGGGTKEAL